MAEEGAGLADGREGDGKATGAGEGDDTPLRPARIAGTGVAIATWNDGGGGKYTSSMSMPSAKPMGGGVGGGLSAYDSLSPTTPPVRRDDHATEGTGASGDPRALIGPFNGERGGVYGGGAVLMTVPGKYLGTKGRGPCIGGLSSVSSVWKVLIEEVSRRASR